MSFLTVFTFAQLRQAAIEAYASEASIPAATDQGSSLGSIFDAGVMCAMLLQNSIIYAVEISRLYSIPELSNGAPNPDVDSFGAQFAIPRIGAGFASGPLLCYASLPVLVGVIVSTPSGLQFAVIADSQNLAYNDATKSYAPVNGQVSVTVECIFGGTIGNVQVQQITQLYSGLGGVSVAGISAVTNTVPYKNGTPAESDAAYKSRITLELMTGRVGTSSALGGAILGVQPGLTYSIGDRLNASGVSTAAYFTIVVAVRGSTTPTPTAILSQVGVALEGNPSIGIPPVRSTGLEYTVIGPTIVPVSFAATITAKVGVAAVDAQNSIQTALTNYIASIGLDPGGAPTTAAYFQVAAIIMGAQVNGVNCVNLLEGLTLNGGSSDVTAPFASMLAVGSFSLNIS